MRSPSRPPSRSWPKPQLGPRRAKAPPRWLEGHSQPPSAEPERPCAARPRQRPWRPTRPRETRREPRRQPTLSRPLPARSARPAASCTRPQPRPRARPRSRPPLGKRPQRHRPLPRRRTAPAPTGEREGLLAREGGGQLGARARPPQTPDPGWPPGRAAGTPRPREGRRPHRHGARAWRLCVRPRLQSRTRRRDTTKRPRREMNRDGDRARRLECPGAGTTSRRGARATGPLN